jgi:hypothetical protein
VAHQAEKSNREVSRYLEFLTGVIAVSLVGSGLEHSLPAFSTLPDLFRSPTHGRHEFDFRLDPIPALGGNQ